MAVYTIQDTTLTNIANAIREKTSSTDTIKPTDMADAINEMAIVPDGAFQIKGACQYLFAYNHNLWLLKNYGEKITTEDITTREYMFYNSTNLEEIPFDINLSVNNFGIDYAFASCSKLKRVPTINGKMCSFTQAFAGCSVLEDIPNMTFAPQSDLYGSADGVFKNCKQLKNVPYIYNLYPSTIKELFYGCQSLRTLPEDYTDTWNWNRIHTYLYGYGGSMFYNCYSLRNVPTTFLHNLWNIYTSSHSNVYYQLFDYCYSLDEVKELGVSSASLTSNVFGSTFFWCSRLKDFTFQTNEDGTPQTAKWKSQTIDLSQYVGYSKDTLKKYLLNYNSGITADKEVFDDITYQFLKDDPDWFSVDLAYSRYNHDSAVNTINSLPDCSATGTNIIKFKGQAGSATDGGAVNTLTEEEIAVATAKGWTVSLV